MSGAMTAEVWSAIFSGATLVVLIVTAIAAIVQLRHLRANTSLSGSVNLMQTWQEPQFQGWISYIRTELPAKMNDPAFLEQFRTGGAIDRADHPELQLADYYEQVGTFLKHGLLDRAILMDVGNFMIADFWRRLEPLTTLMREKRGPSLYENFEYLAVVAEMYGREHPHGGYPRNLPRWNQLGAAAHRQLESSTKRIDAPNVSGADPAHDAPA